MEEKKLVKIADMQVGKSPQIIASYGIGSCVVISLYDPLKKIGGMLHFVLPEYNRKGNSPKNPLRYGNISIKLFIQRLEEAGGDKKRMVAKVAGGALMFPMLIKNPETAIGKRNVEVAKQELENARIQIVGEDTGGEYGRSIELFLQSGKLKIRSYKGIEKEL